jgi:hypothetical protein
MDTTTRKGMFALQISTQRIISAVESLNDAVEKLPEEQANKLKLVIKKLKQQVDQCIDLLDNFYMENNSEKK